MEKMIGNISLKSVKKLANDTISSVQVTNTAYTEKLLKWTTFTQL